MFSVTRRPFIFLLAALTLLIAAGTDLFVVDFISPALCDDSQAPASSQTFSSDDCFCCCAHLVMPAPPVVMPVQALAFLDPTSDPILFTPELAPVYHPPRA
jgi:hypothetical protein